VNVLLLSIMSSLIMMIPRFFPVDAILAYGSDEEFKRQRNG